MTNTNGSSAVERRDDFCDDADHECWNCGGEGCVADCFDGFCINAEDGCELCMTRCDFCNPAPTKIALTNQQKEDGR